MSFHDPPQRVQAKGITSAAPRLPVLKDPPPADAIVRKHPEPIQALGFVLQLALWLFSGVQRRVRTRPAPRPSARRAAMTFTRRVPLMG